MQQNLVEGNVEVYKQKDVCCMCSVVKNRTNARKEQSTWMNGNKNLNQTPKTNSPFQISNQQILTQSVIKCNFEIID